MFGKDFVRDRYGPHPNGFLNYGYSILRAYTARAIMDAGLLPSIGLFHRSYYNSFTLADDLMEPYRPFVDETVYHLYNESSTITDNVKATLANIFYAKIVMYLYTILNFPLHTKTGRIEYKQFVQTLLKDGFIKLHKNLYKALYPFEQCFDA